MFLLSQNDENQSENGSKNSKIRLRARPPAEPQKKMLQTKKLRSKSWKTRVFFTFRLPILDGRVHEQVSSVLFFTVFFEGERHDLSKTGGFGWKMGPPPGKPVTFYECHPDDHAPAPSVRADLHTLRLSHDMTYIPFFPYIRWQEDLEALRQTAADSLLQAAKVRRNVRRLHQSTFMNGCNALPMGNSWLILG